MAVVTDLYLLERLDADLEQRQARLADLRRRERGSTEIAGIEARLAKARDRASAAAAEQRRLEGDLTDLETKLERQRTLLYSGRVVDPREISSLEREMQHSGEQRGAIEEQLLTAMEEAETAQEEVTRLSRQATEARQRWEADRPELHREAEALADALTAMQGERKRLVGGLDPRTLNEYERLRHSAGHAVSRVESGVCQWCRVVIPPKDIQHARAGTLAHCTNCGRILYVE